MFIVNYDISMRIFIPSHNITEDFYRTDSYNIDGNIEDYYESEIIIRQDNIINYFKDEIRERLDQLDLNDISTLTADIVIPIVSDNQTIFDTDVEIDDSELKAIELHVNGDK